MSSFKKYTTEQLIELVNESSLKPYQKKNVVKVLTENEQTGEELLDANNVDDLKQMGYGPSARVFFDLIQQKSGFAKSKEELIKEKLKEQARKAAAKRANKMNSSSIGSGNGFRVRYKFGGRSQQTTNTFTMETTIQEFITVLAKNEIGNIKAESTKLIYLGQTWSYTTKGTFADVRYDERMECVVSHAVVGGATGVDDEKEKLDLNIRERYPDWNNKDIKPSLDQDSLMFIKDDNLRVEMPCGHVFDPQTIYMVVKMCAETFGKCSASCPMDNCDKDWHLTTCIAAADLNEAEIKRFSNIFTNRELAKKDIRTCKECGNTIERDENLLYTRCRCTGKNCKFGDFCWICGNKWIGGGFIVCGNKDCPMEKINDVLQNCEEKVLIKSSANYTKKCPVFRACPRCVTLVEYETSCKHMTCPGCNKQFCFYCLSIKEDEKSWPCNSYADQCDVAPRQRFK